MIKKILRWFRGYLVISIRSGFPERFINLCKNNNIYIWNLKNVNEYYQFELLAKDYKKLKPIAKKSQTLPHIDEKIGFPFFKHKYKKRKAFVIGILIFYLIIYLLSLNIWNISIKGERAYTEETILEFLYSQDIYVGKKVTDIDCRKIEEDIRKTYSDIGWVSAEIKGTNLIINLKETFEPEKIQEIDDPSHIVASKNGVITDIITRQGTPMVNSGEVVEKGDILVSGVIEVIGDNELLLSKEPVVADADIYAKTYYEYEDSFPLKITNKEYTNNRKTEYSISLFTKELNLYKDRIPYENYDIITWEYVLQPIPNFYLPLSLRLVNYDEYKRVEKIYTKNEAIDIAKTRLNRVIDNLKKDDIIIYDNDIEFSINNNSCTAKGNIVVEESIVDYKKVAESEWRIQQEDESIGASN